MSFRKATTLALRLGGAKSLEGLACRAAISSGVYRGDSSYLVSAYAPVHLNLSAATSSTLEAVLLSREIVGEAPREAEGPLHVGDAAFQANVEGEGRSGNVSLHSSMQSNVPEPYAGRNRSPSHLNMPRGIMGRRQQRRFLSGDRILVEDSNSSLEIKSSD